MRATISAYAENLVAAPEPTDETVNFQGFPIVSGHIPSPAYLVQIVQTQMQVPYSYIIISSVMVRSPGILT